MKIQISSSERAYKPDSPGILVVSSKSIGLIVSPLRTSFSVNAIRILWVVLALTYSTIFSSGAFAQDTDPFTGQPAAGAAGMHAPDLPSGEDVQRPRAENGKVIFRSQTEVVEVPAVVTDKSGHALHGLTKDDFRIFEDGKERRIATFEEVNAARSRPAAYPAPVGQFSNIAEQIREPQSVVVVALDTINTPFLDQAYARRQLLQYLAQNSSPSQTLGLVVMGANGVQVLCALGTDATTLAGALRRATGQVSPMEQYGIEGKLIAANDPEPTEIWAAGTTPREDPSDKMAKWIAAADAVEGQRQQARSTEATLKAFLSVAWSLAGVPGRKSLIWLTGSFPFPLDSESALPSKWTELYEKAMQALNDAQVSIYPIDARGLVNTGAFAGGETSPPSVFDAGASTHVNDSVLANMRRFAGMTGGRAFYNTNDLAGAIATAADDSASYYLLGFYLDTHNTSPGWRKLRVQVNQPDGVVRARSGFLETRLTADPELTHNADVEFALRSPFDTTSIPITAQWLGVTQEGQERKIAFSLNMPESSLVDERNNNLFDMDLVLQLSRDGLPSTVARKTVKGLIPAQALGKVKSEGMIYNNFIVVPLGKYEVRFLVRDNLSGRIGTVSAPLVVN
jgi:VWFA-related protein